MRLLTLLLGVPCVLFALACCGIELPGQATVDQPPAAEKPEAPEAPVTEKSARPSFDGRWCEENPEVGCYRFEGTVVHEEEVKLRNGKKLAAQGTWTIEENMLLMRFPSGTWTLEILKHSENILIVKDWSQSETFTFVRR